MLPINPWEHQNAIKTFYSKCVEKVCQKHDLTRMELDILLFLANNPMYDTASDMVEVRFLSKSQVSVSIKRLQERKFLYKKYTDGNRKTVHLVVSDAAAFVISDGRMAQEKFLAAMFDGIPEDEINAMKRCSTHMVKNIKQHLKEETE